MRLLAAVLSLKMFLTQPMLIKDAMLIWMSGLHILPETDEETHTTADGAIVCGPKRSQ